MRTYSVRATCDCSAEYRAATSAPDDMKLDAIGMAAAVRLAVLWFEPCPRCRVRRYEVRDGLYAWRASIGWTDGTPSELESANGRKAVRP